MGKQMTNKMNQNGQEETSNTIDLLVLVLGPAVSPRDVSARWADDQSTSSHHAVEVHSASTGPFESFA